jgi:SAM-dependent methyltransferase
MNGINNGYVFMELNGNIVFVGDFDGLYRDVDDPWLQSEGRELQLTNCIVDIIHDRGLKSYCEIGSGLGYNVNTIKNRLDTRVCGFDISSVAVDRAIENLDLDFRVMDITKVVDVEDKFDCVCLFNCLWYVLEDLDVVIDNCISLLSSNGIFVIAQKYVLNQRYGIDIVDGMDGCIGYVEDNGKMKVINKHRFQNEGNYYDGVLVCQ